MHEKLAFIPESLALWLGIHAEWAALQNANLRCAGLSRWEVLCGSRLDQEEDPRWHESRYNATRAPRSFPSKESLERSRTSLRHLGLF